MEVNVVYCVCACVTKRDVETGEMWSQKHSLVLKIKRMEIIFIKAFLLTYTILFLIMIAAILTCNCSFTVFFLQHLGARNLVLKVWVKQEL